MRFQFGERANESSSDDPREIRLHAQLDDSAEPTVNAGDSNKNATTRSGFTE